VELDDYLERLASDAPVPGGGSAATVVAALGAALVAMVARITANSSKFAPSAGEIRSLAMRADNVRQRLDDARRHDERAFTTVVEAQALPKQTDDEKAERTAALQRALFEAAAAPLFCCTLALDVLELAKAVAELGNRGLASDAGCAGEFGIAALRACAYNVRVNHLYLRDNVAIESQRQQLATIEKRAEELVAATRALVNEALSPK
jgi:formiminotetrahydrofolate cyclodeaminase